MSVAGHSAQIWSGLGSAIGVAVSWNPHQSIIWAAIQSFFGWFYVLYYVLIQPGGLSG